MEHVKCTDWQGHERDVVGQVTTQGVSGCVTVNSKILQSVPCKFCLLLDLEFMREIATQVGDSTFKGKEKECLTCKYPFMNKILIKVNHETKVKCSNERWRSRSSKGTHGNPPVLGFCLSFRFLSNLYPNDALSSDWAHCWALGLQPQQSSRFPSDVLYHVSTGTPSSWLHVTSGLWPLTGRHALNSVRPQSSHQ